ncbi:lamin tail domain-containing protein 1 [Candoia aspera]|uniref:lamin tail domain-containing protein 1 n=1 Tax=Candoia aspera TaxID=51853 RepID=UPI002FD85542
MVATVVNLKFFDVATIFVATILTFCPSPLISKEGNSYAIEKLQTEHTHSQQQIKDLETKLEEIQDHVLSKLKAVEAIQEKNASLQEEITSLKNTLGCIKGTKPALYQLPATPIHFQHISESKTSITAKPSEKVVFSQFRESTSTVTLLQGRSSSRTVRFPVSSLVTVNKALAASNTSSNLLQKQYFPSPDNISFDNEELGKGQDYTRALFAGAKNSSTEVMEKTARSHIPPEYYSSSSSSVGNLKITEVHLGGHYVKIINNSPDKEEGIGDHTLQQNVNGHPAAIFKFPPNIRMKSNSFVTVWSMNSKMHHKPPTDYLWKELDKFQSDPECTTILCNPSGQAVAWYTPMNWKRKTSKEIEADSRVSMKLAQPVRRLQQQQDHWETRAFDIWQGMPSQSYIAESEPDYIIREKKMPPILHPVQNSWCQSPDSPTHPHFSMGRYLPPGSKASHMLSQTRSQLVKPFPDLGDFYSGESCKIKPATGGRNRKNRIKPPRSAGPNLGGVIYIGSAAPIGSPLQKYFAHSSSHFKLLAQASLTPLPFSSISPRINE